MTRDMESGRFGAVPFGLPGPAAARPLEWERDGRDWPNRGGSRFVSIGGMLWHVQIMGRGPVILLLHGTGSSTHSWRDLAPLLARRFTVVAPDLPGHAFTQAGASAVFSIRGFASAISALLQALKLDPVLAVGHSAGAAILARMNLDGLLAARAVVSLNGALLPLPGMQGLLFSPAAKLLARIPRVPEVFARHAAGSPLVERLLAETGSRLDGHGAELYARLARNPGHVRAALAMMAGWNLGSLGAALPRLSVPLVLVAADNDRTVPPRQARDLVGRIPRARLVRLAGLGHLAHEEDPRRIAALVLRVARRHRAPRAKPCNPGEAG